MAQELLASAIGNWGLAALYESEVAEDRALMHAENRQVLRAIWAMEMASVLMMRSRRLMIFSAVIDGNGHAAIVHTLRLVSDQGNVVQMKTRVVAQIVVGLFSRRY